MHRIEARPWIGSAFAACVALAAGAGAAGPVPAGDEGTVLEVPIEAYNNEPIVTYSAGSEFRRLGRAVGQLRIMTDKGPAPCTAFLVSDTHLVTNHHCVPGVLEVLGATRILSVSFAAGFVTPGLPEEATLFEVDPQPVEADEALDYAVLRVRGNPAATFGTLPLSDAEVVAGHPFLILGHPMGKSLHISREGCRAARPPLENDRVRHTCDTLAGNSGSPIIDASTRMVVALHNSGNSAKGVNLGIPMALILARSKVLTAAAEAPPSATPAPRLGVSIYPESVGTGEELSVVVDTPADCAPAFFAVAPSGRITPIPSEIFRRIALSDSQSRWDISAANRYGLVVLEEDERGTHRLGALCPPAGVAGAALKQILRQVKADLDAGILAGQAAGTRFGFAEFAITP